MKKLFSNKKIVMSAIALLLIGVLFAGATFSWSEGGNKGYVSGNDITISTGSNLTMRQDGVVTNSIKIPACTLEETSSADGRNFFFPLTYEPDNYVYFKNTSNYTTPYAHYWGDGGEGTTWPGLPMTLVEKDIYKVQVPDYAQEIIFVDNNNTASKTADLTINRFNKLYNNGTWESMPQTGDFAFREGIAADEGYKYVSVDFQLEAGDNATDVYLGAGTIVQCSNANLLNALRMSFYLNDGSTPTVFKPNQMPGINMSYNPVTTITTAGVPTTTETVTRPYGDYYYKGDAESTPLFHLEKNETKNITLALWLEGTEFSGNDIANSDLSIYIDFTTTVDDLVKYNFVDNCRSRNSATRNHWVSNNMEYGNVEYETMMYIYDVSTDRYYAMEKTFDGGETAPSTWTAFVPDTIKNFYFRRYSIDINEWWNEWEPQMGEAIVLDPNGERTYVAIAGQEKSEGIHLDGCYGYWKDAKDTIRIYFQLETTWDDLHCYVWDKNNNKPLGNYPGSGMTFSHNTGTGSGTANTKPVYYIDIEGASNLSGILFNNGSGSSDAEKYQIEDTQYFFNGFAMWFKGTDSEDHGKFVYVNEQNSLIYPVNDPT